LALGEPREELVDPLARPLAARLRAGRAPRGDPQVLVDGERREEATALRDVADAVPRDLVRLAADELLALEADRALGMRRRDAHDRVAERRLAHPVAPHDRERAALHGEAQVVEDPRFAVERVEARDLEHRRRRGGSDGGGCGLAHRRPRYRSWTVWLARISSGVPSTITRPSCIIVTLCATLSAMSMSCSMRIRVIEGSRPRSSSVSSTRSPRERPEAASSSISIGGCAASAIAIATCRCSPCDRSPTRSRSLWSIATRPAASRARSRICES